MYSEKTFENIRDTILNNIYAILDKREGSLTHDIISSIAGELAKAYIDMEDILNLGFIETNFDTYLDRRVSEFGVYRKQGKKANGSVIVTGIDGTSIENGTILKAGDLEYVVLNDITLPDENELFIEALEVGKTYNIPAETVLQLKEKDNNISYIEAKEDFTGGINIETDEELRERFKKVVTNPSTSGNKYHYEEWALEIDGISKAQVYPLFDGPSTVKVMVIGPDNLPVSDELLGEVTNYINEQKPIGANVTVVTPSVIKVNLSVKITPEPGYSVEEIEAIIKSELEKYLETTEHQLIYSKILGVISNISSIKDFSELLVNTGTSNITISEDELFGVGDIEIIEVV